MSNMSFGVTMSNDFKVDVQTTNNRGSTPEEVAARCVNKIINIYGTNFYFFCFNICHFLFNKTYI